ncbi:MAG: aspartate aminotransferase family protein, partial [Spirochaetota bacterium]
MNPESETIASLRRRGERYLVGGVSSNFRINPYTLEPMYPSRAEGAFFYDVSGKKYIDYFMGHGAVLLGHNHPAVKKAVLEAVEKGFYAELDNPSTIELAQRVTETIPCAESVRYANSGSEATLLALRLARGYTGREKIIRMDGHFHGIHDYVLFNNLAAKIDRDNPGDRPSRPNYFSAGIPQAIARETVIVIPWNNIRVLEEVVEKEKGNIAGIIMNPVDFNNGCITTTREYLESVNTIARENGIVVIYDEILSGFRVGISCAQGYYGVTPDLCTLSKALSNGVPLAVLAGKEKIMAKIMDPQLPVAHGGT